MEAIKTTPKSMDFQPECGHNGRDDMEGGWAKAQAAQAVEAPVSQPVARKDDSTAQLCSGRPFLVVSTLSQLPHSRFGLLVGWLGVVSHLPPTRTVFSIPQTSVGCHWALTPVRWLPANIELKDPGSFRPGNPLSLLKFLDLIVFGRAISAVKNKWSNFVYLAKYLPK